MADLAAARANAAERDAQNTGTRGVATASAVARGFQALKLCDLPS